MLYEATNDELREIDQMPIRRLVDLNNSIARAWAIKPTTKLDRDNAPLQPESHAVSQA